MTQASPDTYPSREAMLAAVYRLGFEAARDAAAKVADAEYAEQEKLCKYWHKKGNPEAEDRRAAAARAAQYVAAGIRALVPGDTHGR